MYFIRGLIESLCIFCPSLHFPSAIIVFDILSFVQTNFKVNNKETNIHTANTQLHGYENGMYYINVYAYCVFNRNKNSAICNHSDEYCCELFLLIVKFFVFFSLFSVLFIWTVFCSSVYQFIFLSRSWVFNCCVTVFFFQIQRENAYFYWLDWFIHFYFYLWIQFVSLLLLK